MAIPPFSKTPIPMEVPVKLPDATGSGKSKMAASKFEIRVSQLVYKKAMQYQRQYLCFCCPTPKTWVQPSEFCCYHMYELRCTLFLVYFRFMAVIFDFRHTRTSDSLGSSLFVLPDPKNMCVAVGMSLLSCVRAKINVIPFLLPVNGRHLCFPTYTDVRQSPHESLHVAGPRKHRHSRWNCIAILYTSWNERISSSQAAILNFPLPVSLRSVVQHCNYSHWIAGYRSN